MGWEVHPDGMLDAPRMANDLAPEIPLYITENGAAYRDSEDADGRIEWVIAIIRDVTERFRQEKDLRARLHAVLAHNP